MKWLLIQVHVGLMCMTAAVCFMTNSALLPSIKLHTKAVSFSLSLNLVSSVLKACFEVLLRQSNFNADKGSLERDLTTWSVGALHDN